MRLGSHRTASEDASELPTQNRESATEDGNSVVLVSEVDGLPLVTDADFDNDLLFYEPHEASGELCL